MTLTVSPFEVQLSSEVAVNVNKAVCGILVVLIKFPEIVAEFPNDGIPVTLMVLSRVQL
jgi:hypothetical protein